MIPDSANTRNGKKQKTIRSKYEEIPIEVQQDRDGTFETQIVKKRQEDISSIEVKIISMYAKVLTTR
ncbi:hypothetical protein CBU02nite_13730 [Clostridium butyricum]|uniref:Mutator family transposase n=1 Tax=Clostridium butyricum TaxID=1492 RepID=A0A512TKT5_CLOBU|nr:transposase-like protein [Clostridium butyricum]GEQ20867.1 hypothetical protein CBU02nite_13730 [Clostridium butyricum]